MAPPGRLCQVRAQGGGHGRVLEGRWTWFRRAGQGQQGQQQGQQDCKTCAVVLLLLEGDISHTFSSAIAAGGMLAITPFHCCCCPPSVCCMSAEGDTGDVSDGVTLVTGGNGVVGPWSFHAKEHHTALSAAGHAPGSAKE